MVESARIIERVVAALLVISLLGAFACGEPNAVSTEAPPVPDLEEVVPHPKLDGLSAQISGSLDDWDMPGLAVAVTKDDQLVFAEGFGSKELGRDEPIDAATLFQIGSVTKSFGATAIGVLVDDGRVAFDDLVTQHLPWFALSDPELTSKLTVRDLLAHRSGIAEDTYPALGIIDGRAVADRARHLTDHAEYGIYRYSNLGYGILGLIVEEVSGMSFSDFLQKRLFEPLGMTNSFGSPFQVWGAPYVAPTFLGSAPAGTVSISDAPDRNVAMPHGMDRFGSRRVLSWQSYDNMQAAGSVVSNVLDMSRYLRFHLGDGIVQETRVMSAETLRELHTAQIEAPGGADIFYNEGDETPSSQYALGWSRDTFAGRPIISHGGGIFGFPAYAAFLPEANASVVVLANGSTWTPYYPHQEIVATVFARLLDLEPRDWHAETMEATKGIDALVEQALAGIDEQRDEDKAPSLTPDRYTGSYAAEHAGELTVEIRDDGVLRMAFAGAGAFAGDLVPWNGDMFRFYFDGGDGQAYSSALATFVIEDGSDSPSAVDLGRFGRYERQ